PVLLTRTFPLLAAHSPHLLPFPTRRSSDLSRRCQSSSCASSQRACCSFVRASRSAGIPSVSLSTSAATRLCLSSSSSDGASSRRSEEHTSELQSPDHLVCRLLLEKKKL